MIKILFLSADPTDASRIEYIKEYKEHVDRKIRNSDHRDEFNLEQGHELSLSELESFLNRFEPTVVHFTGHGNKQVRTLVFQNYETGKKEMASNSDLASLFERVNTKKNIRCVILSACYTKELAEALSKHVEVVIGMSDEISVKAANAFADGFFEGLGAGYDIRHAFDRGCYNIKVGKSKVDEQIASIQNEELLPKMMPQEGTDPSRIKLVREAILQKLEIAGHACGFETITETYLKEHQATDEDDRRLETGFAFRLSSIKKGLELRRSRLIEDIENRLEEKQRVLLIGESGTSKTTLLMEIICDCVDRGFVALKSNGREIHDPSPLIIALKKYSSAGGSTLVAIDNVHEERLAAIFYVMEELSDFKSEKGSLRFILTARIPEFNFVLERGYRTVGKSYQKSLDWFNSLQHVKYPELPPFTREEVEAFIKKYNSSLLVKGGTQEIIERVHNETRGHPVLVRFLLLGGGLQEDVKERYRSYLLDNSQNDDDPIKIKTVIVCALFEMAGIRIENKLLRQMDLYNAAISLDKGILRCNDEKCETLHPRWDMEFLSFLYNSNLRAVVELRKRCLKDVLELVIRLGDDNLIFSVFRSLYDVTRRTENFTPVNIEIINSIAVDLIDGLDTSLKGEIYAFILSNLYEDSGNYNEAVEWSDRAIQLKPHDSRIWLNRGLLFYYSKDYYEAIRCYDKAIELDPRYIKAFGNRGVALATLGDYNGAFASYARVLQLNPADMIGWENLSFLCYQMKRYKEALSYSKMVLQFDRKNANAWNTRGLVFHALYKYYEAIRCYDKAIEIDPSFKHAWFNKGNAQDSLTLYDEAIRCYDKAIELDPKWIDPLIGKAGTYFRLETPNKAIMLLENATTISPDDGNAWYYKGLVLHKLARYEEAIGCYDKVVGIDPRNAKAFNNKGLALHALKRYDEAVKNYDKALEIDPHNEEFLDNQTSSLSML